MAAEMDAGMTGNPILQVGGEQDAVIEAEPGTGVLTAQDSRHPEPGATTVGWEEVQVNGILLSTMPLLVLDKELFPITSVRKAVTVWEVPLLVAKLV
jgi:hypothetical protein